MIPEMERCWHWPGTHRKQDERPTWEHLTKLQMKVDIENIIVHINSFQKDNIEL